MNSVRNRRIALAARPQGEPVASDFQMIEETLDGPGEGQLLCRTIYLSLDPYMRGRMNESKSYAPAVAIGQTMVGGTVSEIIASKHPDYQPGDFVLGQNGWQEYSVCDGEGIRKLDPQLAPVSTALGVLGMPGMTAYAGLLEIGKPQAGETLVVAAASGAVGSMVGQIGKIKGCRVIGVAGSEAKCAYVKDQLGFDDCLNYKAGDFAQRLRSICSDGVDVYFENVGGPVFQAVIPLLNFQARVPVCGLIAHYNATELPPGPDTLPKLMRVVLTQRVKIQGFIVTDFAAKHRDFLRDVGGWLKADQIVYKEDVVDGLDQAVSAFQGLLQGNNFGKLLVRVGNDPTL